jgi:hypothetical protein
MQEKQKPSAVSADREQLRRELLRMILKSEARRKAQVKAATCSAG